MSRESDVVVSLRNVVRFPLEERMADTSSRPPGEPADVVDLRPAGVELGGYQQIVSLLKDRPCARCNGSGVTGMTMHACPDCQ